MKLRECANMQICKYATNLTNVKTSRQQQ